MTAIFYYGKIWVRIHEKNQIYNILRIQIIQNKLREFC